MNEEEDSRTSFVLPALLSAAQAALTLSALVLLAATAYLLYGIFSGQLAGYDALSHADKLRVKTNLGYAGTALQASAIIGALSAAVCLFEAEGTGWVLAFVAAALGFGVPFAFTNLAHGEAGTGLKLALGPFPVAAIPPGAIGAFLIAKDLFFKTVSAVREKVFDPAEMKFGTGAVQETRPTRTSILGKCWEGPYCRTFIREHCPIFLKRQACWRQRRGCYCDEDIVSGAAAKVKGVMLEMAPASESNYATQPTPRKAILTDWQKAERCRNCIIYNEHQREKYRVFLPIMVLGTLAACAALSQPLFALVKAVIGRADRVVQSLSFDRVGGAARISTSSWPTGRSGPSSWRSASWRSPRLSRRWNG